MVLLKYLGRVSPQIIPLFQLILYSRYNSAQWQTLRNWCKYYYHNIWYFYRAFYHSKVRIIQYTYYTAVKLSLGRFCVGFVRAIIIIIHKWKYNISYLPIYYNNRYVGRCFDVQYTHTHSHIQCANCNPGGGARTACNRKRRVLCIVCLRER